MYALTIVAEDGQFSSLLKNNRPNQTPQKFRIVIKDKNDNPPYFPQQVRGPFLGYFLNFKGQGSFLTAFIVADPGSGAF